MGGGKIDLSSKGKRLEDAYPIDTPKGVHALLSHIHHVREGRFVRGDYDASILLIDFEQSMEGANLTKRQKQIIDLVFEQDMTQQDAANILGVSQQAISDHVKTLVRRIAKVNKQKELGCMYNNLFKPGTDYKKSFRRAVDELVEQKMPVAWKNKAIEDLTDAYVNQTGEVPDSVELIRLANYILQDDLCEKSADKVSRTEYPILNRGQIKLRLKRERASGGLTYLTRGQKPSRCIKKSIDREMY